MRRRPSLHANGIKTKEGLPSIRLREKGRDASRRGEAFVMTSAGKTHGARAAGRELGEARTAPLAFLFASLHMRMP